MSKTTSYKPSRVSLPASMPDAKRVNTARREQYLHHSSIVSQLDGKDAAFRAAAARAMSSAKEVKDAKKALVHIAKVEKDLNEQLELLNKKTLRKKLFKNKQAQQTHRLEQSILAVAEDKQTATAALNKTKQVAKEDAKFCATLEKEAIKLRESQTVRNDILETYFKGQMGNEEENRIEEERDRLKLVTGKVKGKLEKEKTCYGLLRQAMIELGQARKFLMDAQMTNTVDLFTGGGIGLVAGLGSQWNIGQAGEKAKSAGEKITRAAKMNTKLPIGKLAKVEDGAILMFTDIVLDGFITDLIVRMTIEKSVKSIDQVANVVKHSLDIQRNVIAKLEGRVRSYSDDLQRTSKELTRVRDDLLREIIHA